MADAPIIYSNGAVLYNDEDDDNKGRLQVTSTQQVDNLNASFLQGKVPSDFIQNVASGSTGMHQDDASNLTVKNETIKLVNSAIKIGNIILRSADNGDGLLIGREV